MSIKQIAKKLLGRKFITACRERAERIKLYVLRLCAKSLFLSKLYVLISSDYNREILSTIRGHEIFLENKKNTESINYYMRRSIHRIEKGLSMRPLKDVFATDYINDLVDVYSELVDDRPLSEEIIWARDVLEEYFNVVKSHPAVDRAREKFNEAESQRSREDQEVEARKYIPYNRGSQKTTIRYDEFLEMTKIRRSVRWYQGVDVDRALIDKAILAASLSPSACNRQPFIFRVIDDKDLLKESVKLPGGITGFSDNIPLIVAVVGRQRAYPHPKDRHLIYIDGSLAAMTFIYALETLGLSSCSINWPDEAQREQRAKKVLELDDDERIIMWISVGYAKEDGKIPYSSKIQLDCLRKYN